MHVSEPRHDLARCSLQHRIMDDRADLHDAVARLVVGVMVADGHVAAGELDLVSRLDRAGLGPLAGRVRRELEQAAREPIDVDRACQTVRASGMALVGAVLSMLARIAGVGERRVASEQALLVAIAERLGVDREQARSHLEPLRHDSRSATRQGRASFDAADAALRQLGLGRTASRAEVDEAYLRLVDRYDPGKLALLGADFVKLAVRELAALTEAYERARGAVQA